MTFLSKHKALCKQNFLEHFSNKDLKTLHRQLNWDNGNIVVICFRQLPESSVSHYIISWLLWSTKPKCSTTVCLFHCRNLLQYLKKPFNSVSVRKSNVKQFCTATSSKGSHQIPKNRYLLLRLQSICHQNHLFLI